MIQSPFNPAFEKFAESIATDCFICSPYITSKPVEMPVTTITGKKPKNNIRINVLTDISCRTLVQGATETSALLYLFENCHNVCVTCPPKIHAKVYIANQSGAVITSANFTRGGGEINFEYGVKLSDCAIVQKLQNDVNEYRKLGADMTQNEIEVVHGQVEELKKMIQAGQKNAAEIIKFHSPDKQREIEDNLIRARVKSESANSIPPKTLLYLWSRRPAKTRDLNERIKGIHPDLCDDSAERVIDGGHFGKLWKHQVGNAQNHLRKSGVISYAGDTKLWRKTDQ